MVDGFDVVADADQVRRRIGVTGQYAGLDEFLTGRENLELDRPPDRARRAAPVQRAGDLIDRLDLDDVAGRRVGELSGGSRRRIDLAASLVGSPSVLFLDEPTTGLDPTARAGLWDVVDELTATGTTVVLTTQYLEEADRLADDIVVLDHGRVAARGTPAELKRLVGGKVVTATIPAGQLDRLPHAPDDAAPGRRRPASTVTYSVDDADAAGDARRPPRRGRHRPSATSTSPHRASTTSSPTSPRQEPDHDHPTITAAARPRRRSASSSPPWSPATCAPPPACRNC